MDPTDARNSYRGYQILAIHIRNSPTADHWVYRVFHNGEWIDTFMTPYEASAEIDKWLVAP